MLKKLIVVIAFSVLIIPGISSAAVEISDGSIKGLWHLDSDSVDASGNACNGTDTSIVYTSAEKKLGSGAAQFLAASSSHINTCDIDLTGAGTIGAWVRWTAASQQLAVDKPTAGGGNPYRYYAIGVEANDKPRGYFNISGDDVLDDPTAKSQNNWHWLVLEHTGTAQRFYVDNVLVATSAYSGNITTNDEPVEIGYRAGDNYWTGQIDEVFIANTALSTSTLDQLWNSGNGNTICVTIGCASTSTPTSTSFGFMSTTTDALVGTFFHFLIFGLIIVFVLSVAMLLWWLFFR